MFKFPLWAITDHIVAGDVDPLPCSEPGKAAVFGTPDKLLAFLTKNLGGGFKILMAADRDGLIVMIADFHRANVHTIIFEPELDGSGGREVSLTEFMARAGSHEN
jgi:hypothetical protein